MIPAMPSSARPIRTHANGIDFAALAWGPDDGPLALCLHGYPDTAQTWRHLGPHLAERGHRVVAPYTRGYAPTSLAPDGRYGLDRLARDAAALRTALGGDERAVLIGHDWGAATAYAAAGEFRRIVTLAVAPGPAIRAVLKHPRAGLRQARMSWYMAFQQVPGLSERALPRLIPRLWRDWSPGYDARDDVPAALAAIGSGEHATAALRYYRHSRFPGDVPSVPTLYLHGERDGCQLPDGVAHAQGLLPPGSRAEVVADAGHFLHLERPADVNARIAAFLDEGS